MPQIRSIQKLCNPGNTDNGDALSALVVAVDVIMKYCRHLKYIKNITMITDGKGTTDWSEQDPIAQQINNENINLNILFPPPPFTFHLRLVESTLTTLSSDLKRKRSLPQRYSVGGKVLIEGGERKTFKRTGNFL